MKTRIIIFLAILVTTPAHATTLLFDFGRSDLQSGPNWNNVIPATTSLNTLFDSAGNVYGTAGFEITDTFFQTGEPSSLGSEATPGYPVSATDDYFFGHTTPFAGAIPNPLGQFRLFNLDPGSAYAFTFFASRQGVGDTRDATYTVTGASMAAGSLNASNNIDDVLIIAGIRPDGLNEIVIDVTPGPNNDNSNGFYYIGLMQVDIRPVPLPAALWMLVAALGVLPVLRRAPGAKH